MNIEAYLIDTQESLDNLIALVKEANYEIVSLDLETNSAQEKKAEIWGIGVAFTNTEGYYLPIRRPNGDSCWPHMSEVLIYNWVTYLCKTKKLIGHNLSYDTLVWEYQTRNHISEYIYSDTILMKHTINEERPHGLKEVAVKYLGEGADLAQEELYANIEANGGKTNKDNVEMFKADTEILGRYCVWDTVLCRRLFDLFTPMLQEQGLEKFFYEDEVMVLYQVTIDMKRSGFHIDVPYFEKLHKDITEEINALEAKVSNQIKEQVRPFVEELLDKDFPCKRTGNFPKMLANVLSITLPQKDGKTTLSKKELEKVRDDHWMYDWLLDEDYEFSNKELIRDVQEALFFKKNPDRKTVFNLASTAHLSWLFFEKLKLKPLSKTEGGDPACDEEFLDSIAGKYGFIDTLIDHKKLQKLDSTYIVGVLERHIDGILYSSFLQFGTTSGRYSSTNPNLQNLPRVKDEEAELSPIVLKYVNSIKRGFIAPVGYSILNADYSQLEPCCFAHSSGDEKLREVFRKGYDLYSQIAIDVFGLTDCSADKKAKNYLKKIHPEKRQEVKVFCLAVVYGAQANRIAEVMKVDYRYAQQIIEAYLDAYPELSTYMERCHKQAKELGFVKNEFGRIRHLPIAKSLAKNYGDKLLDPRYAKANGISDLRYTYRTNLNNACNFPIQSTAASIVNRSMIATHRAFREAGLDARIIAQVHDENCCIVRDDQVEQARVILKRCMEDTTKISVPLFAEPLIGKTWAEAK